MPSCDPLLSDRTEDKDTDAAVAVAVVVEDSLRKNANTVSVKTYYCLWQAVGNDLMFEVEVIDPKDNQRDMAKED